MKNLSPVTSFCQRNHLVMSNLTVVANRARFYSYKTKMHYDDLYSAGLEGILEAASRFDENRGTLFSTYAYKWVNKYMIEAIIHECQEKGKSSKKVLGDREQEENSNCYNCVDDPDFQCQQREEIDEEENTNHQNNNRNKYNKVVHEWQNTVYMGNLQEQLEEALSSLQEREQKVLRLYFGFDEDEQTYTQIGHKFGLSREWISKIAQTGLAHLREKMEVTSAS